jgi:hypothetical protein
MVNTSFVQNTCTSGLSDGGAIAIYANAGVPTTTCQLYNGTITGNQSGDVGGGVFLRQSAGATLEFESFRTIIAENMAPTHRDISYEGGPSVIGSYNLIGVGGGGFFNGLSGNLVGNGFSPEDPMLDAPNPLPAPDSRVVTLPMLGSPVVGGVPAGLNFNPEGVPMVVDIRWGLRFGATPTDIGALEI